MDFLLNFIIRCLSSNRYIYNQVCVQPDWSVPGTTLDFQFSAASVRLLPWSLTIGEDTFDDNFDQTYEQI